MSVGHSATDKTTLETDAPETFKISDIPPASYQTLASVAVAYVFMMVVIFNPMHFSMYTVCCLLILVQIFLVFGILDLYCRV